MDTHSLLTYQPEEERPIYGITTNIEQKANPFHINFHELKDIAYDVKRAKGFRRKWFYLFGSPIEVALQKQQSTERHLITTDQSDSLR